MELEFTKMEGCGNDFVVIDRLRSPVEDPDPATIVRLADRRTGIGFDQWLIVEAADDDTAVAAFRIFNADGSSARQCGNGARCIARLLAQRHGAGAQFVMSSPSGPMQAQVDGGRVAVTMGAPRLTPADIPFTGARETAERYRLEVAGDTVTLGAVSMGNPHAVVLVDDIAAAPVAQLGPALGRHQAFPDGVNVGFLQITSRRHGHLRVFERGVGETAACGSGACAAMVAGRRLGLLDERVALDLAGGRLVVSWRGDAQPVWLEGPANRVYEGRITL